MVGVDGAPEPGPLHTETVPSSSSPGGTSSAAGGGAVSGGQVNPTSINSPHQSLSSGGPSSDNTAAGISPNTP